MQASQKTSDVQEEDGPPKYITLQARDGTLDEPVDARILLPSDLLRSMLPEKCKLRSECTKEIGAIFYFGVVFGVV